MKEITITIENPEQLRDRLADICCWWEGFIAGQRMSGLYEPSVQDAAIKLMIEFQQDLQRAIKNKS
jgi:hypothetical protein